MYVRVFTIQMPPNSWSEMEAIAERFRPMIPELQGCTKFSFIIDDKNGEYGSVSVWESKAAIAAAEPAIAARRPEFFGDLDVTPTIKVYEALE